MNKDSFCKILNDVIFGKSKADLLEKVADKPQRYIGIFRPTKPKAKILQNLLQSHEIRFGDVMEIIVKKYLTENGYVLLPNKLKQANGEDLHYDLLFEKNGDIYFAEQKVRDDHDSTKKRGQIKNFEKKLNLIQQHHPNAVVKGFMFFIDKEAIKNKKYYAAELNKMSIAYGVDLNIFYGEPFFAHLGMASSWDELVSHLKYWKTGVKDLPEINFDLDADESFEQIKVLANGVFRKLIDNDEIWEEIVLTLFPEKKTLRLLLSFFQEKAKAEPRKKIYTTLKDGLADRLK